MRPKKNYAMMKLNVPKRATLPNGRTFIARYKKIPRDQLLPNIVMRGLTLKGLRLWVEDEDSKDVEFLILSKSSKKSFSKIYCKKKSQICSGHLSKFN